MIRKAKFENFKGLRDVEVTFAESRITVLVGPNGTGKTSVLQGLELLVALSGNLNAAQLRDYRGNSTGPLRVGMQNAKGKGFLVRSPNNPQTAHLIPGGHPGGQVMPLGVEKWEGEAIAAVGTWNQNQMGLYGSILRPQFVSNEIARPAITNETPPPVTPQGGGLPALLGYLKLRDDELYADIERRFCAILPNVRKLRIDEQGGNGLAALKALLFDTTYAAKVPAHHMSDGTLYILALIVAVLGPHRPKTLLIDDIDMRLHPKAQYELVTLLKKFLEEFPDLQIIATSHSPYILDKLEPNEVLVTGLGEDGSVVIAPLTDHPAYEKWKNSMSPGEFWSHTGEEWLKKHKRSASTP